MWFSPINVILRGSKSESLSFSRGLKDPAWIDGGGGGGVRSFKLWQLVEIELSRLKWRDILNKDYENLCFSTHATFNARLDDFLNILNPRLAGLTSFRLYVLIFFFFFFFCGTWLWCHNINPSPSCVNKSFFFFLCL